MESMYCWPSVSIKRGASLVIARKIVKAEFEWIFGYLLIVIDSSFSNEQVARVITSKNAQFIDPYLVCNYFNFYFAYLATDPMFVYFLPEKYNFKLKWPRLLACLY